MSTLLVLLATGCSRTASAHRADPRAPASRPAITISRDARGDAIVTLSDQALSHAELKIAPLSTASAPAQALAYGRLQEDPAASFTLTAPVAGTLQARSWPDLGESLEAGTTVGTLLAQLAPADRLRLAAQLATSRGDLEAAEAAVRADRWNLERVKRLNAAGKIAPDSQLQQVHATLLEDQARLEAARQTGRLLRSGLDGLDARALPLVVPQDGQVVGLLATPGEAVQAGQALLQVADLDRLLVRVEIPAGEPSPPLGATARIVPVDDPAVSLRAVPVALGAGTDVTTDGEVRIYRVVATGYTRHGGPALRPGLAVTAYLSGPTRRTAGVVVPASALVFESGKPFAYVERGKGVFERIAVPTDQPAQGGYFASGPALRPGDRLVEIGAQALLSEEQRSHFKAASS